MSGIKILRGRLGLSQELMAVYLDIPRSQLAMAEINQRDLQGAALLKLNALEMALQQLSTANANNVNRQIIDKNRYRQVEKELDILNHELYKQQKKLEDINKKQEQAFTKIALAGIISSNSILTEKDAAWLKVIQADADAILKKYPATLQSRLQIQLEATLQKRHSLTQFLKKSG